LTTAESRARANARRTRTIAANETREAATASVRAAKTTAGQGRNAAERAATTTARQGRNVAERAALVYVGATLEARDRAVALVTDLRDATTTRKGAEQRISELERRGTSARIRVERDVRHARTRLGRIAGSAKERVTAIA
jgi:hypothetical protein